MISFNARVTTIIATAITWLAFYEPIGLAGVPHDVLSLAELRKLEKLYQDVTDANDDRVNNYHYLKPLHISDVYQPIDRLNDILESASWKKGVDSNIRHATLSNEEGDSHYVNMPFFSETEVRDGEHLQHSALHGYHEVSGELIIVTMYCIIYHDNIIIIIVTIATIMKHSAKGKLFLVTKACSDETLFVGQLILEM